MKPIDARESATGIVLAYVVNELPPDKRRLLLDHIRHRIRRGAAVLVVEPIARSVTGLVDGMDDARLATAGSGRTSGASQPRCRRCSPTSPPAPASTRAS